MRDGCPYEPWGVGIYSSLLFLSCGLHLFPIDLVRLDTEEIFKEHWTSARQYIYGYQ